MPRSRCWLFVAGACLLVPATAGAEPVPGIPTPAPQWFIDAIDSDLEANTGVPVLTDSNDNATTWVADTVAVLDPSEALRFRLYTYAFSDPEARDCATYQVTVEMTIRADGPDAGLGDNNFVGIANEDFSVAGGSSYSSPAVGATETRTAAVEPTASQLRDGLSVGFGATTVQRDTPDVSSGYTFGAPTIDVAEDDSGCPPPRTTTTTTTPTTIPAEAGPHSDSASPPAGPGVAPTAGGGGSDGRWSVGAPIAVAG